MCVDRGQERLAAAARSQDQRDGRRVEPPRRERLKRRAVARADGVPRDPHAGIRAYPIVQMVMRRRRRVAECRQRPELLSLTHVPVFRWPLSVRRLPPRHPAARRRRCRSESPLEGRPGRPESRIVTPPFSRGPWRSGRTVSCRPGKSLPSARRRGRPSSPRGPSQQCKIRPRQAVHRARLGSGDGRGRGQFRRLSVHAVTYLIPDKILNTSSISTSITSPASA